MAVKKIPKVSVLIIAYNHENFISSAIESVLEQNTQYDYEILIGEDDSTDSTREICKEYAQKYPKRIKLFLNDRKDVVYLNGKPTGKWNALNLIHQAQGEYLCILEGDDFWNDLSKLEKQIDFLDNNPDHSMTFHPVNWLDEINDSKSVYRPPFKKQTYSFEDLLENINFIAICSVMFKTKIIKGIPDWLIKSIPYGDLAFHAFSGQSGPFGFIDSPMATYRRHVGGIYSGEDEVVKKINTLNSFLTLNRYFNLNSKKAYQKGMLAVYYELVKEAGGELKKISSHARTSEQNNEKGQEISEVTDDPIREFNRANQLLKQRKFYEAGEAIEHYYELVDYSIFEKNDNRPSQKVQISVIIVAYNTNTLLLECLASLAKNKSDDYEIILVDNGKNEQIVKDLKTSQILYIKCPTNFYLAEARNIGANFAKGKYLAFLDDDATVPENYVESILQAFKKFDIFSFRGKILPKTEHTNNNKAHHYDLGELAFPHTIDAEGNSAYLRETYVEMGGMDPLLFGHEGTDLSFRYFNKTQKYGLIYWPNTLIFHDYAITTEKLNSKEDRHQLMLDYLRFKHVEILNWLTQYNRFEANKSLQKAGNSLLLRVHKSNQIAKVPTISVCIPTYNRTKFVLESINSVLNQNASVLEIVIVDDGSTDNTAELIGAIKDKRIKFIQKEHSGAPQTRNRAIEEATGEYILWLDSDDLLISGVIKQYLKAILDYPEVDVFYGNLIVVDENLGFIKRIQYDDWYGNNKALREHLVFANRLPNPGILINRSCYTTVGQYDIEFSRAHDYEWLSRAVDFLTFKHINVPVCYYRSHSESLSPEQSSFDTSFEAKIIKNLLHRTSLINIFQSLAWDRDPQEILESKIFMLLADRMVQMGQFVYADEYYDKAVEKNDDPSLPQIYQEMKDSIQAQEKNRIKEATNNEDHLPIRAIIAAYNEGDIIYHVIGDLVNQGIKVYFMDHHSTDNTVAEVEKWQGKGLLGIETFPEDSGYPVEENVYSWRYILRRKEDIVHQLGPGWYIHADADEFRESPWLDKNLAQGIRKVEADGYNAINFKIYDFHPTHNQFVAGKDVRQFLTLYDPNSHIANNVQVKCWKYSGQEFNLWKSGGHSVEFENRKIYPLPFILRHYAIRSQQHGLTKVFKDRKPRWDADERAAKWHDHYSVIETQQHQFLRSVSDLILYTRKNACKEIQDIVRQNPYPQAESGYYEFSRPEIQEMVSLHSKRILDVGCATGKMGSELKSKLKAEVWGIEPVESVAAKAEERLDKVICNNVESAIPVLPEQYFDTIIFADVLEHLKSPEAVLEKIKSKLTPGGEIIVSVPNIRHWSVVRELLEGKWEYQDAGILDKTHLRFFTKKSITDLITKTGFLPIEMHATRFGDDKAPDAVVKSLKAQGLAVTTLQEESMHYQYLLKANNVPLPVVINENEALVSIIILTYNALEYTQKCINSILTNTQYPYEIIFVDNNSTDGTKKYLRQMVKEHKHINAVFNKKNKGFAAANNQGVKKAQGKYVMLLNNDVLVAKGWLAGMVTTLEKDNQIGMVGPLTNSISGLQKVANVPYKEETGFYEYAVNFRKQYGDFITPRRRIAGFAVLMKKSVYEEVKGFDEDYGTGNYEDDDLCLKVREKGYAIMVDEGTFIHHFGSQTFKANQIDVLDSLAEKGKVFKEKWPNIDYEELLEMKNPLSKFHVQKMEHAAHYVSNGEADDALAIFTSILNEHPLHTEALLGAALCQNLLKNFDQALVFLNKIIELDPENSHALNQCGVALSGKQDYASAKSAFILAIEKNPELIDAQRNYADCLIESGDYENGVQTLNTIHDNHPHDLPTLLYLAELNFEAQRYNDVRSILDNIFQIDPQNELGLSLKQLLKTVENTVSTDNEPEYVICVLPWNERSGGTVVMHKFCHLLNTLGKSASLYPLLGTEQDFYINEAFNTPVRERNLPITNDDIVVYPEIVKGNPLKAKNVVRWLLNKPGVIGGDGKFSPTDIIFYQHKVFLPEGLNGQKLRCVHTDFDIFKNMDLKREGTCFFIGKANKPGFIHPKNAREITREMSNFELAEIFNQSSIFYCYDNYSFLSKLAALCGCLAIVVPDGKMDEKTFKRINPVGVAFGEKDRPHALETMNKVQNNLRKLDKEAAADTKKFITKTKKLMMPKKGQKADPSKFMELEPAVLLLEEKKFEQALELVDKIIQKEPQNSPAYNLAGLALAGLQDFEGAKKYYLHAIQNDHSLVDAQRNYGDLLIETGDFENGIRVFNKILDNHPNDIASLLYLADLNFEAGHLDDCRSFVDRALIIDAAHPLALKFKALVEKSPNLLEKAANLLGEGKSAVAASIYQEILVGEPNSIEALYGLAVARQMEDNIAESREILSRVIRQEPEFKEAHTMLGNLELIENAPQKAISHFKKSLEIDAQQPDVSNSLANALIENEEFESGINILMETVQAYPDHINSLKSLGLINLETGNNDQALLYFQKILEYAPQEVEVAALIKSIRA